MLSSLRWRDGLLAFAPAAAYNAPGYGRAILCSHGEAEKLGFLHPSALNARRKGTSRRALLSALPRDGVGPLRGGTGPALYLPLVETRLDPDDALAHSAPLRRVHLRQLLPPQPGPGSGPHVRPPRRGRVPEPRDRPPLHRDVRRREDAPRGRDPQSTP